MTEAQIKELTDKLTALEQQLQNQSGATASATVSSSATPGPITVKVPRERKLRKFAGGRDDGMLEEWIGDATRAIAGQTDADAVDFLLYHLDGVAKEEVRLRPAEERASPAAVFKVLRDCFSEGLTSTQALRKFFERRQKDRESVREFSHALMLLLARVERLDAAAVTDKDKLLRDQFLENLADPQLRRDIKRWVRDHPTKTFQEIRDEVQRWIDEDGTPPRKTVVREVTTGHPPNEVTCDEVKGAADLRKVISELVTGQKILAENLQKQQKILAEQIQCQQAALERQQQAISQLSVGNQQWWQPGCFGCGSRTHLRRDCPSNNRQNQRAGGSRNRGSEHKQLPALNEKAPRQ